MSTTASFGCFELVRSIAAQSSIESARLDRSEADGVAIAPSDVHDMATLVESEPPHIHAQVADAEAPVRTYYPGRKLPSHVYQRVGILYAQLTELEKQVRASPEWLERQPRQ